LLPEFRTNLLETKAGDHRNFQVTYPDTFGNEELRGHTAAFSVDVQGVRERRIRPLDDDFAKDIAGMRDLAELRARVRLNMEGEARVKAQREQEEALMDQIIARNPLDLPESMVGEYLEELVQRLRGKARSGPTGKRSGSGRSTGPWRSAASSATSFWTRSPARSRSPCPTKTSIRRFAARRRARTPHRRPSGF